MESVNLTFVISKFIVICLNLRKQVTNVAYGLKESHKGLSRNHLYVSWLFLKIKFCLNENLFDVVTS